MKNFKTTKHAAVRKSQRGISSTMVDYVLINGIDDKDKVVLGRKEILDILEKIEDEKRLLMKMLDKGGIVVVAEGETVITAYNRTSHRSRAASRH
jgi:copper(I)-binding protein